MSNSLLVKIRIVFLLLAFVHLVVTAIVTLNIDTTVDEDPRVRAYYYVRWMLITCWFNLITLAYLPARLYCEWKTRQGDGNKWVKMMDHATDVVFTGLLFPVVVFSDVAFWIVFVKDPSILAPPQVFDDYLPYWAQHSLHTVSLVVVVLDLLMTPRQRPKSLKPRLALLSAFAIAYGGMIIVNYIRGEMVYKIFETMSLLQIVSIILIGFSIALSVFIVQWRLIEIIWGKTNAKKIT